MPISFCIVGVYQICILFFLNLKNAKNILFFIGVSFILAGYFVPEIFLAKLSINLCILLGFLICFIGNMIGVKGKVAWTPILSSFILSAVYLLVCARDYNYLFYFRPLFLFLLIIGVSIVLRGVNEKISFVLLTFMTCEILSFLVVGERLTIYPLFSQDIILCIALIISFNLLLTFMAKTFKRRKKIEKNI